MQIEIDEEKVKTVSFWLTNILRHLSITQGVLLTKELAERCGLDVIEKKEMPKESKP